MRRIAVGTSGEVAAGKATAGKALERLGFGYTRISKVIDKVLKDSGEIPSRERHQELGWRLHREKGQAWLCEEALGLLGQDPDVFVLDGMRWPEDAAYMRGRYGEAFVHIHVTAPEPLRKHRFEEAGKGLRYEDVINHHVEQAVGGLAAGAHKVVPNWGGRDEFVLGVVSYILQRQINAR